MARVGEFMVALGWAENFSNSSISILIYEFIFADSYFWTPWTGVVQVSNLFDDRAITAGVPRACKTSTYEQSSPRRDSGVQMPEVYWIC